MRCDICGSERANSRYADADIWKCKECGFLFVYPQPDTSKIESFYSEKGQYDAWIKEIHEREKMWSRRLAILLKKRNQGHCSM